MSAIPVAQGATPTELGAGVRRTFIWIQNQSDEAISIKFDGSAGDVTTADGFDLAVGSAIALEDPFGLGIYDVPITAVHGGTGNKEVRVMERLR